MTERSYPDIGTVFYIVKPRNTRISIKITKNGTVEVSIPSIKNLQHAESFVLEKKTWILKKLQSPKPKPQLYTQNNEHFTPQHSLTIEFTDSLKTTAVIKNKKVIVSASKSKTLESEAIQGFIKKVREQALKIEANAYIYNRVSELAKQHAFTFKTIKITSAKTRWGACNSINSIVFSCYIMTLPSHLIDFIIIHELCHTIHKNHRPGFHALLEKIVGSKKREYEKELKKFGIV